MDCSSGRYHSKTTADDDDRRRRLISLRAPALVSSFRITHVSVKAPAVCFPCPGTIEFDASGVELSAREFVSAKSQCAA
jgi:hypothetical protein